MSIPPLPLPRPNQAYWNVSALEAGNFISPCAMLVTTAAPDEVRPAPALAFLLVSSEPVSDVKDSSSQKPRRILFDLGVRKDFASALPPAAAWIAQRISSTVTQDVIDSLAKGGLTPSDIDLICLSHIHWDHIGDPSLFPESKFVVGGATRTLFQPGFPDDSESMFPGTLLPTERTDFLEIKTDWLSIGPFPHALDYFEDGSLYIVDAPGHLPGHVNLLVRISSSGDWLYLAGDSAHDWRLIRGEGEIAVRHDGVCVHVDKEAAAETIRHIGDLLTLPRAQAIIAHDADWYEKNKGGEQFWPGKIDHL